MDEPTVERVRAERRAAAESRSEQASRNEQESRNILVLAVHQILVRVAWVFKTESVIIPAFMDHIAGAGWLRGCLPVLSRFGQSVPPLLFAEKLKNVGRKKWVLLTSSLLMAIPFLILSVVWISVGETLGPSLPYLFLLLYWLFFSAVGINQLAFGTVQGKLVSANRRGRLMSLAGVIGTLFSVVGLLWLLADWLQRDDGGFGLIFGFTGTGFVLAGVSAALVQETADPSSKSKWMVLKRFTDAYRVFAGDPRFRRLAIVAMCFCPLIILFPHYQTLGRRGATIQASAGELMTWVVTQNVAIGVYSFIAGYLADRFGNRLVLRIQLSVATATPLIALLLASPTVNQGGNWYWLTFIFLGIAPVTLRTMVNFNLELTAPVNHPRYVSTLSLCSALPFLASPLVGWLIDAVGFGPVFAGGSLIIATGCLLSIGLPEPRHAPDPSLGDHA